MPAEGVELGKRILVITGGGPPIEQGVLASAVPYDVVIAADSGLDRARALGIEVDIVVGDLDSASAAAIQDARDGGYDIEVHPTEKEHTDFELALRRAVREEASEIAVIGGGGGRPDHWLANLSLLAATARAGVGVTAEMNEWLVFVVVPGHGYAEELPQGLLLSLLPIGGEARGITTEGLAYPLQAETLPAGSSRGVSNVARGGTARVAIQGGTLLVIRSQGPLSSSDTDEVDR
jgi:thiamine pyrophosphokinase